MSAFSDYFENKIIDHMLRNQAFTPPTAIYVALFTAVTGLESNSPSAEVSGGGYVRKVFTLDAASGGASQNAADIIWDAASGNWGDVTHAAIVDHETNTNWGTNVNVLMWAQLTAPKTVNSGDIFKILDGELDVAVQ